MAGKWEYIARTIIEDGKVLEYSISFYRQAGNGWYDELRYESHDRRRGRKIVAPHFHMKLSSAFKSDPDIAVEEIRQIIDNYVKGIREVLDK